MLPLTAAAVEANSSNEATVLSHTLHMQQGYTRSLLGSREEYVSVAEINNACGSLLRLLQHLIDWHRIPVQNSALRPNGEQSTVEAITARGSPLKVSRRVADFFINEKFFAWKTFGTGCSIVTSCVLEIVSWMTDRLQLLADDVRQHLAREEDENSPVDSSVSSCAAAVLQSLTPPTPPYVVTQDRVDGFSVRHGDVSDELWTIAIKKLLAVVQWCVMASRDVDSLQRLLGEEGDS
ncbi:hypothetical protein DQ04_03911000 [Trypanosoma grayi]|uniref:hypothetical protein n=1 Tax=Trypanosoma grayi TaxID=71804 RepID=UPI0004F42A3E|nr:hypothetical protein DQ04_03911000 [Trypanosoma grayi]KEG10301.1 hypothetical protein DQ04_03911000 [Trypanosoma grayi]